MKRASLTILALAAVLVAGAVPAGAAITTTVSDFKDVGISIDQGTGNLTSNSGVYGFMNADLGSGGGRRMMMQFDMSSIPAGATITSAILRVCRASATDNTEGKPFSAYAMASSWVEGWGTSNGSPATGYSPAGATWSYSDIATATPWTTPGGDLNVASRIQFVPGVNNFNPTMTAKYGFEVDIASIAQSWLTSNNGLAIVSDETVYQRHAMLAREYGLNVGNGANTGPGQGVLGPTLEITYEVPEPMTMSLLVLGGLGLLAKKRR